MNPNAVRRRASWRTSEAATTYSASTSSSVRPRSHAGPSDVWTSSATSTSRSRDGSNRLSIGWSSRALVRAWTRRTGSPGAYGRTPANRDGSSTSPWRARSRSPQRSIGASSVVGDRARPDEERVDVVALLDRRAPGERIADRQLDRAERVDAAAVARDVEPAHDALVRPQRPRVAQHRRLRLVRHQVAFADLDARARVVVGPQPGERQAPPVPDLDRERQLVAERHVARAEHPAIADAGEAGPGPGVVDELEQAARPCPAGSRSGPRARSRAGSG